MIALKFIYSGYSLSLSFIQVLEVSQITAKDTCSGLCEQEASNRWWASGKEHCTPCLYIQHSTKHSERSKTSPEITWEKQCLRSAFLARVQVPKAISSTIRASWGFPGGTNGKDLPAKAGDIRDMGLIPGWGRSPGKGYGNPLQYSCLENHTDRGVW